MSKTREFKWLTEAESEQLRREAEQMWSTVPENALARARQLAGVEAGKEHEFRVAYVRESYGIGSESEARPETNVIAPDSTPRSEVTMEGEIGDCVRDRVSHKRFWVRVWCDGGIGELHEDQPITAFRDDEHAIRWVQDAIQYLNVYLPERLRTMALLTVREAIAKSSEAHDLAEIDWKTLAGSHADIVADKIKQTHGVHSGRDRLFKNKQQYMNFLAEASRTCKARGERLTQEWAAEFASGKFSTERAIDVRMIRKWNRHYRVDWNWYAEKVNRTN